ncbi:Microcystin-dependent protein [Sphingobacterium nematocida]|uniref:Microcystin-dependent protein n=1 Tax=Sphingobacterium nematocida TaxID=1513896 RepID=A0A1T5BNJ0_9SPHI|nr:tail fiber protein [Sphingobacterium nematocida]SKB48715.1 Microcystin-dependent protein [Sphingobacterium nematocida]
MASYVGEIRVFAGNFAPAGWMFCEGQLLPISENETLFNLIGTTYGGDGESTFALPDLRGRIPIHQGNGFILAETGGAEEVTLTISQIPAHNHFGAGPETVQAKISGYAQGSQTGSSADPTVGYPAIVPGLKQFGKIKSSNTTAKSTTVVANTQTGTTGGSEPHTNFQPYLCVNFIISLYGIYPSPT